MIEHVAVVVPAADEQALIGRCLHALQGAVEHLRATVSAPTVELVVVLDSCRDRTEEVVAAHPEVRIVVCSARCVGAARAFGTAEALAGRATLEAVWTAHTDADSAVPRDWLSHMVRAANSGVDLVLGTVRPDRELRRRTRRAWHDLHSVRDGHRHVHGANLGIRAATLQRCGGWLPLHTGEDVDLAARSVACGARVLRTGAIAVRTSARVEGRAPMGFSSYLLTLAAAVDAK